MCVEGDGVDHEGHDGSETMFSIDILNVVISIFYFVQLAGNPVRGSPQLIMDANGATVAARASRA